MNLNLILKSLQSIIFPYSCCLCHQYSFNEPVCKQCWSKVLFINKPFCNICGKPFFNPILLETADYLICEECREEKRFFAKSISLAIYQEEFKEIIHQFKFYNKPYVGNYLGKKLSNLIRTEDKYKNIDIIMPVPLQKKRERERGYNQSLIVAKIIAKELKIKLLKDILRRRGDNPPQSNLSLKERKKNIRGCFYVKKANLIKDKRILIIDDVFTTGSTVNECARVLRHSGAREILVATLARTG